tara:strand:- start:729 stop:1280 length:552 start_codon:yes stop_codon:yes gene_type:complete
MTFNIIKNDIYDVFGEDCGNIILEYKQDLDEYIICKENYNKLLSMLFTPKEIQKYKYIDFKERGIRIDEIRLDRFIYFLQTYVENTEIFNHYDFKINIRDMYGNFNIDYIICNRTLTFAKVINLKYSHGDFIIRNIHRRYKNQITIGLFDTYQKKPTIFSKLKAKIIRLSFKTYIKGLILRNK